jgi:AraC family transcriptional regulator of adaptative response/methylated-DNA-[protein]-cysteine methyltransferase
MWNTLTTGFSRWDIWRCELRRKNRVAGREPRAIFARMSDYERIARIIRWLDEHHAAQPDLTQLAALAGLSPHHFHRLFSRWAGVTPKDFLQCLTFSQAREQLRRGATVFDAAHDSGLSSPGRLHDLCLSLDAATPGEVKSGGAGWTIEAGFADSPFGLCCAATGPRGLVHLAFTDRGDRDASAREILALWPRASLRWNDGAVDTLTERIFRRGGTAAPLRAHVAGTAFQIRVWRALLQIPAGAAVSYGQLASAAGNPGASRAAGTAVGRNAIAFLIPCHRVIRETGVIGHYRWNHERKRALLAWEAARCCPG